MNPAALVDERLEPRQLFEIELSEKLPWLARAQAERAYRRGLALIRLHGSPLGLTQLDLPPSGLPPDALAPVVWRALGAAINKHLREDGLPTVSDLKPVGLECDSDPECLVARRRFLDVAPEASVVVATRERPAHLASCLRSLFDLRYPRFEIVVVDNAPTTAATRELVEKARNRGVPVRYVREDQRGLAAAHNRGLQEVKGSIVAFTDDDVIVDRDWLTELVWPLHSMEGVACVTGLILPAELETPAHIWLDGYARLNKGFERSVFRLGGERDSDRLFPYAAGQFGSGANMAFDVVALRGVGGFDPATGAGTTARGGDDLLAFFRIVTAGYTLVYEPRAILWHAYRAQVSDLRRQMFDYGAGLTAYLTSILVDRPRVLLDMAPRLAHGIAYALSSRSPRNRRSHVSFERKLIWAERLGMGYGPLAYLISRRRHRKFLRRVRDAKAPARDA